MIRERINQYFQRFQIPKRQKFVLATVILLFGIVLIRIGVGSEIMAWRIRLLIFSIISFAVTIAALRDQDFNGIEWLTLPVLPSAFALGTALVYPLIPYRLDYLGGVPIRPETSLILTLLIKLVFLAFFVIGYYATLLTSNIFNVAAVRSIQLLRVAHSIGFLSSVATALMFYIVIGSFHLAGPMNFLFVFLVTFALSMPTIWSVNLANKISATERNYAITISLVLAEVAWILSFWPVGVSIYALFLTALFYELVGIIQYHLGEKLNRGVVNEFILVGVVVFVLTLVTTVWGA